ncbi:tyrosine-type recombinase/integrase [Microcoleus sp. D2_18a_D3]|uniref:tyrosine-type recombinase/integrase n=1 Tax=Microcoleus sp. D2_18a_D3 TaxID=3055330 RepID=UPI002FCF5EA1
MYAKTQAIPETVKVQSDNGTLRLQFSTKYNPIFGGKRKHQGLSLKDTPDNWQKAIAIAYRIEGDLQHPDWQQLFDPSFAKYGLKTKYAAELKLAAPIPEPEPEMTVGAMWEDYLVWKQPQLEPTTFKTSFAGTYTNTLKGLLWNNPCQCFDEVEGGIYSIPISSSCTEILLTHPVSKRTKGKLLTALQEAFNRLQSQGKTRLTNNPFARTNKSTENKIEKYKSTVSVDGTIRPWYEIQDLESNPDERDRRAFTKEERDIIIKAFYESVTPSFSHAAPLVEFLFLTGCRSGEAFALTWNNIKFDSGQIVFYKSYATSIKDVKTTKNNDARLFVMYPKLRELLLKIKPKNAKMTDLVFRQMNGNSYNTGGLGRVWMHNASPDSTKYYYPGVVTQLVEEGKISTYLSPYHTRHTFITLQARAGIDLTLLASICSTGVDKIHQHYLEHDKTAKPLDI